MDDNWTHLHGDAPLFTRIEVAIERLIPGLFRYGGRYGVFLLTEPHIQIYI
jgi:hypothetical protein